jgi:uncharacterized membrane protein
MQKVNWLVAGSISIVVLLLLFGGGMLSGWGYRGWGMMGPGMMGWGHSPFGWIGMSLMWLIPIGFIVLTVFGIVWLVRNIGSPTSSSPGHNCPNCGKDIQANWQNCPYCGTTLK